MMDTLKNQTAAEFVDLLPVLLTVGYAPLAFSSNSAGLIYPIMECLRWPAQKRSVSSNTSALAASRVRWVWLAVPSVSSDEKQLSIAASSRTLPERLMEQVTQ
jgi:hypothetical protein